MTPDEINGPDGVRRTLFVSGATLITAMLVLFYYWMLSPEHRDAITPPLESLGTFSGQAPVVFLAFVSGVLAYILTYLTRIHQQFWEGRILRWRVTHDVRFTLPRVLGPLRHHVRDVLFEHALEQRRRRKPRHDILSRLFESFLGGGEESIDKRVAADFFRASARYWQATIVQPIALSWLIMVYVYFLAFNPYSQDPAAVITRLAVGPPIALILFCFSLYWLSRAKGEIKETTIAAIREIHEYHLATLESRLLRIIRELPASLDPVHGVGADILGGEFERQMFNDQDLHLFVAAPMAGFTGAPEYEASRAEIIEMVRVVRGLSGARNVFYAGEDRPVASRFEDEADALRLNLSLLSRAQFFVAVLPSRVYSSTLVEIGIAIRSGIPGVLFVKDRSVLPYLLKEVDTAVPSMRVKRYRDLNDLIASLIEFLPAIATKQGPPDDIAEHSSPVN